MRYETGTERQGFADDVYGVWDNDTYQYVTECDMTREFAQEVADRFNAAQF